MGEAFAEEAGQEPTRGRHWEGVLAEERVLRAQAWFLGDRIDIRALDRYQTLEANPRTIRVGADGCASIFRYGAVVLLGLTAEEEAAFLQELQPAVQHPFSAPESDEAEIVVDAERGDRIDGDGTILLRSVDVERIVLVAHVLAKSAVLAHYERRIAEVFERIEPQAEALRRDGRMLASGKELLRQIGDALLTQTRTISRFEVTEKPELTWDDPELDRLYVRLGTEYELRSRDLALTRKLELVSGTAKAMLDILQSRSSIRVEWYIVALILAEILLIVYDIALRV